MASGQGCWSRWRSVPDGGRVHLLSAYDTAAGIVLAQIQIAAKSNEIPTFAPLLEQVAAQVGSLAGAVIVADALHAQTAHARDVAARGAHLMVPVKANQPTALHSSKPHRGRSCQLVTAPARAGTAGARPAPSRPSPSAPPAG